MRITIDGISCDAAEGEFVKAVADRNDIPIPSLCHHSALPGLAACRLCVVEATPAGGGTQVVTSCVYPVREGLEVCTTSARIQRLRRIILRLLISRAPAAEGRLVQYCREYGVDPSHAGEGLAAVGRDAVGLDDFNRGSAIRNDASCAGHSGTSLGGTALDDADPDEAGPGDISSGNSSPGDSSRPVSAAPPHTEEKCILCGLCVKACDEMGASAIATVQRGVDKQIQTAFGEMPADCIGCLSCAKVCPTESIAWTEDSARRVIWKRSFELERCSNCGKPYATVEELSWLRGRATDAAIDLGICPRCRARAAVASIAGSH